MDSSKTFKPKGRNALVASALAALLAGAPAVQAQPVESADRPLVVGGARDFAACSGGGDVIGLDPHGDNFLSVRSGPGGRPFHERDRITTGMHVKICDMVGAWFGIVYAAAGARDGCGVDRPSAIRWLYHGPCRQGWVYSRYIANTAE